MANLAFSRHASGSHFSIPFFPWLEATQERRGSRVKPARSLCAAHAVGAQRRGLTRLPRSVHSSAKNGRFPPLLYFQDVNARQPRTCWTTTRSRGFFFLAACFLKVHPCKRGKRPFFAPLPPSSLIPCALTHVNRKLLCSSRSGVTCHPYSRRRRRRKERKEPQPRNWPPGAANRAPAPLHQHIRARNRHGLPGRQSAHDQRPNWHRKAPPIGGLWDSGKDRESGRDLQRIGTAKGG